MKSFEIILIISIYNIIYINNQGNKNNYYNLFYLFLKNDKYKKKYNKIIQFLYNIKFYIYLFILINRIILINYLIIIYFEIHDHLFLLFYYIS